MINMKKMLIIGRFQPFHSGHLSIIKKYHRKNFFIKIVIGSIQKEFQKNDPFTKDERIDMIKKSLEEHNLNNYEIIFVPDVPSDKEWVSLIKKKVQDFDVLFTGNPWVKRLFKKENIEIHEYDERFDRIKGIKARDIRKNLLYSKNKKGLPNAVFNHLKIIRAFDRLKEMNDSRKKVQYLLNTNKLTISTAESCTGGSISKALISYSGASKFFIGGVIAYSVDVKKKLLNVSEETISKGIVSVNTATEMALGSLNLFNSDYAISSTGYADPYDKECGNICIAVVSKNEVLFKQFNFKIFDRNKLIDKTTKEAIKLIYVLLKKDLLEK